MVCFISDAKFAINFLSPMVSINAASIVSYPAVFAAFKFLLCFL